MTDWQPIETAPRDGTQFIAWAVAEDWVPLAEGVLSLKSRFHPVHETYQKFGRVDYDHEDWEDSDWIPTHWMPLPEPPTEASA